MNRRNTLISIQILTLGLLTAASSAQVSVGPPCVAPPENATQEVIDCYEDACENFKKAWGACTTTPCRIAAELEYAGAIGACLPALTAPTNSPYFAQKSTWITLSYIDGEWTYSFDGQIPAGAIAFRF